jgi:hypothetical protein
VETDGGEIHTDTRDAGPFNEGGEKGTGRWYPAGTLLPSGEVLASSGADADEVALPGSEAAIRVMELFDPVTETWKRVAAMKRPRSYHNTATLLPDGRVLIGGHATISTGYGRNLGIPIPDSPAQDLGGPSINDGQILGAQGHDPTMEIWSPPYLFRGARPEIGDVECDQDYGDEMTIPTNLRVRDVERVVIVRNASTTHVVDGDQKSIILPIDKDKSRDGNLVVDNPPNANVAPPGPYMLFVNRKDARGPVPSESRQVSFGGDGACP